MADGAGDGIAAQAGRGRRAGQERLHARQAALPLQGLRAELHRHAAARDAAAAQGVLAVLLYVSGLSMNRTAKLLGVSTPSVMHWIEQFAREHAPKPEPEGRAAVIELDEMWHYLKKRLIALIPLGYKVLEQSSGEMVG